MFEHILFANNDLESRGIFYEIFTNLGYKITTVVSAKDVLEILKKERPDYIALDPAISDIPLEAVLEKIKIIDENIKTIVLDPKKNKLEIIQDVLKALKEKSAPQPQPQEHKETPILKAAVLVVDDENEPAQLLKNYLSRRGYNVDTASSGEEAIVKIKTSRPNIVFLDIRMSGMDGMVALKAIKDIDKSISVIMTTAMGDDEIIKEATRIGANGYLVKPFNLMKLETKILTTILTDAIKKYLA